MRGEGGGGVEYVNSGVGGEVRGGGGRRRSRVC